MSFLDASCDVIPQIVYTRAVIVWDDPKRLANLGKRGFDFSDFEAGFDFERAIARSARPSSTGRVRVKLIGAMNGIAVVAIVSPLGSEAYSLVSLRPANREERQAYAER